MPADQVLGREATESRGDEAYQAQRNRESLARTSRQQQEMIEAPERQRQQALAERQQRMTEPATQQPAPAAGADSCDTYSTRKGCIGGSRADNPNWSPRRGYYGNGGPADQKWEQEQEIARQAAARTAALQANERRNITNCSGAYCYDNKGGSYRQGTGNNLRRNDGANCTPVPGTSEYRCR